MTIDKTNTAGGWTAWCLGARALPRGPVAPKPPVKDDQHAK